MNIPNHIIGSMTNPENGHVTLYLLDCKGGPIITGNNYEEALIKFNEALQLAYAVKYLNDFIKNQKKDK